MAYTRPTRDQRLRQNLGAFLLVVGLAAAVAAGGGLASVLAGHGWHPTVAWPSLAGLGASLRADPGARIIDYRLSPAPAWLIAACAGVLAVAWIRVAVLPLLRAPADPRQRGLAQPRQVHRVLSAHAARRAGRFTRPDLTWGQRYLPGKRVPLTELGYQVGTMRGRRDPLWANFELRVRVIARTGWGKTARFLVKAARDVPGAALIGSTKADLFEQTVRARQARGAVLVVDFSEREHRYAAGFDRLHWDLVPGCEDWHLAQRRARGLVAGAEDGDREDNNDAFFRDSAGHVIAAWLHAAALGGKSIRDIIRWQQNIALSDPHDILERHPYAEKAARLALLKHLDERAERTTSSVERFVVLALAPFATRDGEDFVMGGPAVDLRELIRQHTTIYLLASPTTAAAVSPLLTMLADEWFHTARSLAIELGGRLPLPAVGVLDELRMLVPIPSLPQVAYEMRSYGIGVIYALQNGRQEEELYGAESKSLAQNVQLTILGGYDEHLVDEIVAQAGPVEVASPSANGPLLAPEYGEGTHWRDTISAADMQQLADGQAVMRLAGLKPFYATLRSFRQDRRLRRAIAAEEAAVRGDVAAAQAVESAERESRMAAAQAAYDRPAGAR